ncbi:MAG: diguanylate cyclase [Alcanivoracaceae bacterium]|jgi:diguanylate cyclase (GGDEF)-like protein|nr:diguanylate cyclase [Alcanivoracaceae bacterium]
MLMWRFLRRLPVILVLFLPVIVGAQLPEVGAVWTDEASVRPLGLRSMIMHETEGPLDIDAARGQPDSSFNPARRSVSTFGIGPDPVWIKLLVDNPTAEPVSRFLLAGTTWIDRLDFYAVHAGTVVSHQVGGDAELHYMRPLAGMGYLFRHDFPSGTTEVYLRAQTEDPLLLPLRMLTPDQSADMQRTISYSYGVVYGFVAALLAYNLMLYFGLMQPSHRDYSIYLLLFGLMNLAYTGHGYTWIWSDWPWLQNYIILVLMVLFVCSGFRFASGFLGLREYAPNLARWIRLFCLAVITLMTVFVVLQWQREAALLSFITALIFAVAMVGLGWDAVRRQRPAGRYFLAAAFSGMVGTASTTLTVWGWLPFSMLSYRAVEFGILIEATLLALAVAYLVRQHESARHSAEQLARIDSLTGLLNRRALLEQGEQLKVAALRHERPLSLILFDLDHFKFINDLYGHAVGDEVLRESALMLRQMCRREDLAARWGGEEFVLLLPDADIDAARNMAERLRNGLIERVLWAGNESIALRASFGVVTLREHESIERLIADADALLYRAKQAGRNQVRSVTGAGEAGFLSV